MNSSKMTKKMSPMFKHKKRHHKIAGGLGMAAGMGAGRAMAQAGKSMSYARRAPTASKQAGSISSSGQYAPGPKSALMGATMQKKAKKTKHKFSHKKHHKVSPLTGLTEGSPADMKADAKMANKMDMHKKPKLGSGKRFAALKSKLGKKGASNPGALAAFIGRKKFGAKKFAKLSAGGKKHKVMCKKAHKHGPKC
jgi:hypothetical protein